MEKNLNTIRIEEWSDLPTTNQPRSCGTSNRAAVLFLSPPPKSHTKNVSPTSSTQKNHLIGELIYGKPRVLKLVKMPTFRDRNVKKLRKMKLKAKLKAKTLHSSPESQGTTLICRTSHFFELRVAKASLYNMGPACTV